MHAGTCAQVRAVLDAAGAADVKVLPAKDDMLYERVGLIIGLPEPDWAAPRPPESSRGGDWGAQRTILFSGMRSAPGLLRMLCGPKHMLDLPWCRRQQHACISTHYGARNCGIELVRNLGL